jgi:hypothetical protein
MFYLCNEAPVEITKLSGGETETYIEQGKIVAAWCGRYDDINKPIKCLN